MKPRSLVAFAALAMAVGLSGCVSLFPKAKPAQLYRFAYRDAAGGSAPACAATDKVGVITAPPNLPRAAAGDQLLTVTGDQAAYIADSRWVSPASSLFEDAVDDVFQASCQVRLVKRADVGAGALRMRIDVDRFETDYAAAGGAPVVKVALSVMLLKRDGDFGDEAVFTASAPAADNRVGAIVSAYSAATTKALLDLKAWTEAGATRLNAQQSSAHPPITAPAPPLRPRSTSSTTTSVTTQGPR